MRIIYVTALLAMNGSLTLAIPKMVEESLGLAPDMLVGLSVAEERLIVEPRRRPAYRLGELLLQCDRSADMTEDDRLWLDAAAALSEKV